MEGTVVTLFFVRRRQKVFGKEVELIYFYSNLLVLKDTFCRRDVRLYQSQTDYFACYVKAHT